MINFERLRAAREPVLLKRYFPNVPTWGSFIAHLDHAMKLKGDTPKDGHAWLSPNVRAHPHMSYVVYIHNTDPSFLSTTYPGTFDHVRSELQRDHPLGLMSTPGVMLISFTTESKGLGRHGDRCDQMHWNCIGKSRWYVYKFNDERAEFILEPGDLIFIPTGMHHEVYSLTPRAAITFSANMEGSRDEAR